MGKDKNCEILLAMSRKKMEMDTINASCLGRYQVAHFSLLISLPIWALSSSRMKENILKSSLKAIFPEGWARSSGFYIILEIY